MGDFHVKKIILPSGKAVEIVYFHAEPAIEAAVQAAECGPSADETSIRLEICPTCRGELTYPTDWREAEGDRWELELRCPNCEWSDRGVWDQADVERYDAILNAGTDSLIESLERITRENMEAEIERFVDALEHGHIEPFDF